jgi:tRNA pseudouridine55 synthase
VDGVLIIDKPAGMTSHDVVARVRRILDQKAVGHLGTLDPSATGVLPLVVGRFTRLAAFYTEADKRYEGTIRFGLATDTYDAEGEPTGPPKEVSFSMAQLQEGAARFVGRIEQMPPPFSAKKIGGIPAYKLARKKQDVRLKAKPVEVKEFQIVEFDGREALFKAWVSSGTYVRSLAHELGAAMGSGAHLGKLKRTAVREFKLEEAFSLEQLAAARSRMPPDSMSDKKYYVNNDEEGINAGLASLFLHPRLVLPEFPAVTAPPEAVAKIRHGNPVNLPEFGKASLVRVFEGQQHLISIARRVAGTLFQPKVVLI